jgi:hypothetical protein
MKSTERELELMVDRKLAVDALVQSKTADGTRFADVLHDLQRWMRANTKPTKGLSLRDAMYEEIGRVAVLGAGFSPDSGTIDYRGLTEHSLLQSLYVTLERLPAHARSELSGLRDAVIKEAGNVLNTASAKHDDNAFGAELLWYCGEVDSVARQWLGDQAMVPVLAEAVLPVLRHFAKQDSLIHPAGTIPPDHFHEKGVACGPIMGTKTALGYALHGDNNLTVQRYSQYLNERLAEQIAWVRKAMRNLRMKANESNFRPLQRFST